MIKLEVSTHSGETDVIEVDEYDATEITELRNGNKEAIAIGDHSYSRIDIKNIKPMNMIQQQSISVAKTKNSADLVSTRKY